MGKKKRTVAVLSEAKFRSGVDAIIQREFFPSSLDKRQPQQQSSATLEDYLRTHTSEDTARFQRIVDSDRLRRDERHSRVFGSEQSRCHSRSGILLEPQPTALASSYRGTCSRMIVPKNTRLVTQSSGQELEVDNDDDDDDDSVAGTPVINGYRMLRDTEGSGGFRLVAPSPRELVALRLGKRPTQAAVVRASNTRLALSPAAHRLLLLQGGHRTPATPGSSSDLDLRRAYNSPR